MLQNEFLPGETKRSSGGINKMLIAVAAAAALILPLGFVQPALAASTITINYDASPGEFSSGETLETIVVNHAGNGPVDKNVPVPSPAPTRENYSFTGWYDGMTLLASPTDTVINVKAEKNSTTVLDVKAGWDPLMMGDDEVTFNSNFDLDYLWDGMDDVTSIEIEDGGVERPEVDPIHPSMDPAFTFAGWARYVAGKPVLVVWDDDMFLTEDEVTLFAVWDFNSNLFLNGGIEVATDATEMTLASSLGSVTTPEADEVSREDYQLAGFQFAYEGACTSEAFSHETNTLELFLPGEVVDVRSTNIDFVACWTAGLTYSANNMENETRGATYTQPVMGDEALDVLLRIDQILARYSGPDSDWVGPAGKEIFVEWSNRYTQSGNDFGCNGASYLPGEPLPEEVGERYLYACWDEVPQGEVLIQYNLNDGTFVDTIPPQSVSPDSDVVLPDVEREGSEFLGWVEGLVCTSPSMNPTFTVTEENKTFTACFEAETYVVTLVDVDGTGSGSTTQAADYGDSIALNPETAVGYTFVKWVSGTDCEADAVTTTGSITEDATFTACWTEAVTFTITLVDTAGTGSGSTTVEVNEDDSYALTAQTASGYTFVKWVSGTDCTALAITTTGPVTADATFKACWTVASTGGGGGTGGAGTTTPVVIPTGAVPLDVGIGPFVSGLAAGTYSFIAVPPIKSWVLNVNNGVQNLQIRGLTATGKVRNMNALNQIILRQPSKINVIGSGYLPNSQVALFMFSPANPMGVLTTSSTGTFNSSFALPAGMKMGLHHVQVTGLNASSNKVTVTTPVWFAERTLIVARSVYFNPDSAVLTPAAKAALEKVAERVKESKARSIQVNTEGYVYPVPDTSVYQSLSRARARAVVAYLRSLGVKATSFSAIGRGAAKLEKPTSRRTEILVTGTLVGE